MENRVKHAARTGQSLVEYAMVLALLAIIVVTVVMGIGQRSRERLAAANETFQEEAVATRTSAGGSK